MIDVYARPQAPWALRLVPPFPTVAQRVLALVNNEDTGVREVGESSSLPLLLEKP